MSERNDNDRSRFYATLTPTEDVLYRATEDRVADQCRRAGKTQRECATAATQAAEDAVSAHRRTMRRMREAANAAVTP